MKMIRNSMKQEDLDLMMEKYKEYVVEVIKDKGMDRLEYFLQIRFQTPDAVKEAYDRILELLDNKDELNKLPNCPVTEIAGYGKIPQLRMLFKGYGDCLIVSDLADGKIKMDYDGVCYTLPISKEEYEEKYLKDSGGKGND